MKTQKKLLIKILLGNLLLQGFNSYAEDSTLLSQGNTPSDAIIITGSDKSKPLNLSPNKKPDVENKFSIGNPSTSNSTINPSTISNKDIKSPEVITLKGSDKSNNNNSNIAFAGKSNGVSVSIGNAQKNTNQSSQTKSASPEMILKGGEQNDNDLSNGRVINFGSIESEENKQKIQEERNLSKNNRRTRVPVDYGVQSLAVPNSPIIASGVPIPSSNVVPLPPLPGMNINSNLPPLPDMSGQLGILHSQPLNPNDFNSNIENNGTNNPIVFSGKSVELPPSNNSDEITENYWGRMIQNEVNNIMNQGSPLKIIIVDSQNFLLKKFILQGLLKGNDSYLSNMDTGLYPVMSQSYINGVITPTCYLMFDQKNVGVLEKEELNPLSKKAGQQATAAFIAGHMVGHCLDQFERSKVIPLRSIWFSSELEKYGVIGAASRRIFGNNGVDSQVYFTKQNDLFKDLGQRQYEERVADIFGLLWSLKENPNSKIIDAVSTLREKQDIISPHNTIIAIRNVYTNYKTNLDPSLSGLWKEARNIQLQSGIVSQLSDGASSSLVNSVPKPELSGAVNEKRVDYTYTVGSQFKSHNYNDLERNESSSTNMKDTKNFNDTNHFTN